MGKRSNAFIDDISKDLKMLDAHLKNFNVVKKNWFDITNEAIELVNQRVEILYTRHQAKERLANQDPDYVKLGRDADKIEETTQAIEGQLNRLIDEIETSKSNILQKLGRFDAFVKQKQKDTKNPFKKLSVSSSKKFIKDVTKALAGVKPNLRPS
ncbi:Hypothetical protein PBC10988_37700 [Planctomycetales bacterium 10988]|nr:Hypothetical protein PBC10988_37700 [Planctomycetales bacterium 10988]